MRLPAAEGSETAIRPRFACLSAKSRRGLKKYRTVSRSQGRHHSEEELQTCCSSLLHSFFFCLGLTGSGRDVAQPTQEVAVKVLAVDDKLTAALVAIGGAEQFAVEIANKDPGAREA